MSETLASLSDLAVAIGDLRQLLDRRFGPGEPLVFVHGSGKQPLAQVVPLGKQLQVIGDICAVCARLANTRNRFQRAAARALYDQRFTTEEIARVLGVTHQRVSGVLRHPPNVSSAPTEGSRHGHEPAQGSRQQVIQRSYEWMLLHHASGRTQPAPGSIRIRIRMKAPHAPENRWAADAALPLLADLADAAGNLHRLLDRTFGGVEPLAHVHDSGRLSFDQVVPPTKQPQVIGAISEASTNLADACKRYRHTVARALYEEAFTMQEIARVLDVTRQRVSALLGDHPVSSARAGTPR